MDIVELNRATTQKKVNDAVGNLGHLTKHQALTLLLASLKKEYGSFIAVKILHSLGIKNIDLSI